MTSEREQPRRLDCAETTAEIRNCPFDGKHGDRCTHGVEGEHDGLCPLWSYRLGRNPRIQLSRIGKLPNFHRTAAQNGTQATTSIKTPGRASDTPDRAAGLKKLIEKADRRGPLGACRKYCLWCCCDSAVEVRLCSSTDCSLHPMRFGRRPRPDDKAPAPNGSEHLRVSQAGSE